MNAAQCPLCYTTLETREVAPCWDCGHEPSELEECAAGEHEYNEFRAFGSLPITLCDFCDADFASYYASHFGCAEEGLVGDVLEFIRQVSPDTQPRYDKYCPRCQHRLAFLEFRAAAIADNTARKA